jgi:hypothetical protein
VRGVRDGAKVRPNRELAVLRNLFNRLIKFKKYEGENPVQGFEPIKECRGKDRILDPEEERRLLEMPSSLFDPSSQLQSRLDCGSSERL